jgi:hypothetical protein
MGLDERTYCPAHQEVQEKIGEIQRVQKSRPCQENTVEIKHLKEMDSRIEKTIDEQGIIIDRLRRLVYMGAGATAVLAFLGAIIGGILKK